MRSDEITGRPADITGSTGTIEWKAHPGIIARIRGQTVTWKVHPRRAHVAIRTDGKPLATLRYMPNHKCWSVKIEGFSFITFNKIMNKKLGSPIRIFPSIGKARAFAEDLLLAAGAESVERHATRTSRQGDSKTTIES